MRRTELTDKMCLHYFELPKLTETINMENKLQLWLALFKANTEEDLKKIEKMGVPEMSEAIEAYNNIVASVEFCERERMRDKASRDEAQALSNAEKREREKWQGILDEKDKIIAELKARLGEDE